ncbi:MAG: MFS transporter [Elusimicrobia bacterium]|nr:MFS transporter [Elusimicrobiota bacterium]
MRLRRAFAASLAALLALLAPGPQAWAAVATAGVAASGQALPAATVAAVPAAVTSSLGALSATFSFDLSGRSADAAPRVQAAAPQSVLTLSVPAAVLGAPAVQTSLSVSASADPAAPARTQEKVGGLAEQTAPVLEAVGDVKASPADLRRGGAELQRLLESGLRRHAAPADLEPSQASESPAAAPRVQLAAARGQTQESQAAEPVPELAPHQKRQFRLYGFGVSTVKTGLDALNLAVPLILMDTFHAAMAVSALYLASELSRLVSGALLGSVIDRIGAGRALALTVALQIAATVSLPFILMHGGALAIPMVFGAFIINGIGYELFDVARRAALPLIVGKDEGVLRAQNGRLYVWREMAATAGVFGAGWVVKAFGALNTIWVHPIFCFAAALAMLRLWNVRPQEDAGQAAGRARISWRAWLADLRTGMRHVFRDPKLRALVLINIPLTAVHKLFHTVVSVVFAASVLHNPTFAAIMVGAWNVGELAGSFYLDRWGKNSHFSSWLRLAAAASLSMWIFYLLPVAWAAVAASFLIAAAMIGNELGTASYMQSKVPAQNLGAVTGFVYGLSRAVGMLALAGAGWAFDVLSPQGGFMVLAIIFTIMAPIYLLAAKRFASEHVGDTSAAGNQDD